MSKIKSLLLTLLLLFLTACGTESQIDPRQEFDLWDYLTSYYSYDVTYQIYENNTPISRYNERHTQLGDHYIRQSNTGKTTLFLGNRFLCERIHKIVEKTLISFATSILETELFFNHLAFNSVPLNVFITDTPSMVVPFTTLYRLHVQV